jgi:hypothetical protein
VKCLSLLFGCQWNVDAGCTSCHFVPANRHEVHLMHFITSLLQSCKAVYDRIIDLKIATPQIIINYALFLEEHKYFEEAFRVSLVINTCFWM